MGTLYLDVNEDTEYQEKYNADTYARGGCTLCPLAKDNPCQHPDMPATGAKHPLVYVLGEAPGADEDELGEQFVGGSGQFLRARIPREFNNLIRFNNVVRTRPPRNRTPEFPEIECCRPSVVADIEASKPKAVFGFGNVPLNWVCGFSGVMLWRGRRMPVKIGSHVCWYYPMLHPAFLVRQGRETEEERMFRLDLKKAFGEVRNLPTPVVHCREEALRGVELLTDVEKIKRALRWASQQPIVGFDYETNALRPYGTEAKILTVAIGTAERSFAFPIDHPGAPWKNGQRDDVVFILTRWLAQSQCRKAVHNLAFELEWTGVKFGIDLIRNKRWEDTAQQAVVLDERVGAVSLEFLVQQYFGFNIKKLSGVDRAALENVPLDRVLQYNAVDAKYHFELWQKQDARLKQENLQPVYELALRRVPTVVLSQIKGLPVDQATVRDLKKKYEERVADLERKIAKQSIVKQFERIRGTKFNPLSNKDVLFVFWDMQKRMECRVTDKYGKDKLSVEEEVLQKINDSLATLVIKLRKANRQLSTYIVPLQKGSASSVVYPDGLIHTSFNTWFARTGRLSSDSPNLQNFPKRDDEAKEVRRPIAARRGELVVAIDYGQIEARVIAMFTKDKVFCKALWEEYDVHMNWAEQIAHAYPSRIGGSKNLRDKKAMKDFRTDIKNQWTFSLFFGASLESASGYLHIPEDKLAPLYRSFWKEFSGVRDWQERQLKFYQENGYVECLTGRRRYGPLSPNKVYNSPVQGTAAEIVLDAMARVSELNDIEMQPEINIHDDLTWVRVPEKTADLLIEKALDVMLAVPFSWVNVPITAEVSMGKNWAELHDEGTFRSDKWK